MSYEKKKPGSARSAAVHLGGMTTMDKVRWTIYRLVTPGETIYDAIEAAGFVHDVLRAAGFLG